MTPPKKPIFRFGDFLFDASIGELTKSGIPIRLQEQPARVLGLLIERRGELVSRQDLRNLLWPEGVNVDYESGLNSTMRRLRQVLLDEAEKPRYVETIPKRGYRFLAAVSVVDVEPVAEQQQQLVSRRWLWGAGIGIAGIAVAGAWSLNRRSVPGLAVRSSIVLPPGQLLPRLSGRSVAISTDGRQIAFVSASANSRQICRRNLSTGENKMVPGSSAATSPFFTLLEDRLMWTSGSGLYREHNNEVEELVKFETGASLEAARQTTDGDLLYLAPIKLPEGALEGLASECWIWRKGTPKPERIAIPYGGRGLETLVPQDLLDGRYFVYGSILGPQARSIWVLDLKSGLRKELIGPAMGGRCLPGGRLLYYWAGNLLTVGWNRETLALQDQPRIVLSGVASGGWAGPDADLSSDGTLVFRPNKEYPDWKPVWVSLDGKQTPIPVPPGPYMATDLSRDGRFLLLIRRQSNELGLLLSYDLETGAAKELARDVEWRACWSPDRKRVAIGRSAPGDWLPSLHVLNIETGQVEWRLPSNGLAQVPMHWVEGSDEIYFTQGFHPKSQIDLYRVKFRDEKSRAVVAGGTGSQTLPKVSPDRRWVAFSNTTDGHGLLIRNVADTGIEDMFIPGFGTAPMWSANGKQLYYRSGRSMYQVELKETPNFTGLSAPVELFSGDFVESTQWDRNAFFDERHNRFLMALPEEEAEAPRRIEVITNWLSTLG